MQHLIQAINRPSTKGNVMSPGQTVRYIFHGHVNTGTIVAVADQAIKIKPDWIDAESFIEWHHTENVFAITDTLRLVAKLRTMAQFITWTADELQLECQKEPSAA